MRVASFNVENLFEGAKALAEQDWEKGPSALEAYAPTRLMAPKG
jgi:hypothetical protein